jgi:hypothetical protein
MENADIAAEIDRKIRDNFGLPVNFVPATPTLVEVPPSATERPAAATGKAARATLRPAIDEASVQYDTESEAPSLFSDAA